MPSRFVSLAILVYWCVAAFCLLTWEVLPELSLGYPPDLRTIALAGDGARPVAWSIEVLDDPHAPEIRRRVGSATTESRRLADGWLEMGSKVKFDAGLLLQGTPLATKTSVQFELSSVYRVDASGNLRSFDLKVTPLGSTETLFNVKGRLRNGDMEVVSQGLVPILNQKTRFPYEPRSVVNDPLGPIDRLPGLHLGQRWDTRVVNPFSGKVERARVEVKRRALLHWNGGPVSAFEVVQSAGPVTSTTWVRPDGLILRQEVPFPMVRLILERVPVERFACPGRGGESMIELRGVTKLFGTKRAVDGLDLTVRGGELFAFLGPNGAGKTTTIKMICGLLSPTTGIVRIGGHEASSPAARQLLGYVPDQPYLYDKLTGREFLRFVVEMYGLDRHRAMARTDELIETFEMGEFIDDLCENYSQGMKQRVVFASALVHEPRVLVVDEPLVGLDPRSARIVKNLFVSQARGGAAVLMSIHLLAIAEELADTIGIVDQGRMLTVGTLDQLRDRAQHDGSLEDLFLKLTGQDREPGNRPAAGEFIGNRS